MMMPNRFRAHCNSKRHQKAVERLLRQELDSASFTAELREYKRWLHDRHNGHMGPVEEKHIDRVIMATDGGEFVEYSSADAVDSASSQGTVAAVAPTAPLPRRLLRKRNNLNVDLMREMTDLIGRMNGCAVDIDHNSYTD